MQIIQFLIHTLMVLLALGMIILVVIMIKTEKGPLTKSFRWLSYGLMPFGIFHLIRAIESISGMNIIPPDGMWVCSVLGNLVSLIACGCTFCFLLFFHRRYIRSIYGK